MKTTLIVSLFLFVSSSFLFAQNDEQKGDLSAGVSAMPIYFYVDDKIEISGFGLRASFGVFLSNKISLENSVFYFYDNNVIGDGSDVSSKSYGLNISLRYHFISKEKISFFANVGAGLGVVYYATNDLGSDYSEFDSGTALYTVGIGSLIKLYKELDFEVVIPYMVVLSTTVDENIYNSQPLYSGLVGPTIGFRYNF